MENGISIYFNLDNTKNENIMLIEKAKKQGFTKVFMSFLDGHVKFNIKNSGIDEIIKKCNEYGLETILDVSPKLFSYLSCEIQSFYDIKNIGINSVRLNYGYNPQEINELILSDTGLKIYLNASTINQEFLKELDQTLKNYDGIGAIHNFYLRKNTGISTEDLLLKNNMLKKRGIKVGAFVHSDYKKRGPLNEGADTVEFNREINSCLAAKHLFVLENDFIIIGDSMTSENELINIGKIKKDVVELTVKLHYIDSVIISLLGKEFTSRMDNSRDCVRALESRRILKKTKISRQNTIYRKYGDVTLDNELYDNYKGELQIIKTNLIKDKRVNVIGFILEEEYFLIKYIEYGKKFSFRVVY